ncbi:MAG TPA: hypothetical protein ENJ42_06515 [Hellea balneolensis]|uniref:Lipoprotein n=1 Tax=Hellea balneolensis TaxID=287478 RepID=A0A7C5LVI8_9PROT|nr:hypothetical protein [Hellea balneolensis]
MYKSIVIAILGASLVGGCAVAKTTGKVAALPFKAAYKTGELTGKGVYYTGKGAGTAVYKTGEYTGKGIYYTGKGAYKTAKVPVTVMNGALDTSAKVLSVTTQMVDLTGKVVTVSRSMQRSEVDGYVAQAQGAANVLSVVIDAVR